MLSVTPDGRRQSPLDHLRDGPVLQSTAELARAVTRLDEVWLLAAVLPRTDRLPRTRVLALARFAGAAKASAVARLPDNRRLATLIAFIRTLEATAQDGQANALGRRRSIAFKELAYASLAMAHRFQAMRQLIEDVAAARELSLDLGRRWNQ